MKIPVITGRIARRLLINYRVAPEVMARQLPAPFHPQVVNGHAVAGICLIRLAEMRPRGWPAGIGFGSENAAHRLAVEWATPEGRQPGVYIARRETNSRWNALAGGRWFPGVHQLSKFEVTETADRFVITISTPTEQPLLHVDARRVPQFSPTQLFASLAEAVDFFRTGSVGYSPAVRCETCEGLQLRTDNWSMEPLEVTELFSSYYADAQMFPAGSLAFDSAFLLRDIAHEWHPQLSLKTQPQPSGL